MKRYSRSSLMRLLSLNWMTVLGTNLAFLSGITDVVVFILIGIGAIHHAYVGVIAFLLLPGIFIVGSTLLVFGIWRYNRKKRKMVLTPDTADRFPVFDFNRPMTRNVAWLVMLLTFGNIIVLSVITFEGVGYTASNNFCTTVCHTPMEPQHIAFMNSPHAGIKCVDCHVSSGASGFATAKISGVGQLIEAVTDSYSRPITTHRAASAPVNDACVRCHSNKADRAQLLDVKIQYQSDEQNSLDQSAMVLEMGTVDTDSGIHGWHNQPGRTIEFSQDPSDPDSIRVVRVTEPEGDVIEYWAEEKKEIAPEGWLTMTCIDCHNRVGHRIIPPDEAIDTALWTNAIDASLPHIKSTAIKVLEDLSQGGESQTVDKTVSDYYRTTYPELYKNELQSIQEAAGVIQTIANQSIFPEMNATWETYPDLSGHTTSVGCMRCHDDSLVASNEKSIRMDCIMCHNVIDWVSEDFK